MNQRDRPTPGKPSASVRAARRDAAGGAELTQRPSPSHCPRSALVRYAHRCLVYGGADLLMRASPALRQPHRHQSVWRWGTHPHPVSPCPAAASCPPRRPPSATCRCTLAFVPYPACAVRVIPVLPAARHSCANHRRARRSHFCRAQRSPRRRPRRQRVALGLAHRCPPRARRARPPRCHHLCHPEGMPLGWLSRGTRTGAPLPRRQMQARMACSRPAGQCLWSGTSGRRGARSLGICCQLVSTIAIGQSEFLKKRCRRAFCVANGSFPLIFTQ